MENKTYKSVINLFWPSAFLLAVAVVIMGTGSPFFAIIGYAAVLFTAIGVFKSRFGEMWMMFLGFILPSVFCYIIDSVQKNLFIPNLLTQMVLIGYTVPFGILSLIFAFIASCE